MWFRVYRKPHAITIPYIYVVLCGINSIMWYYVVFLLKERSDGGGTISRLFLLKERSDGGGTISRLFGSMYVCLSVCP